MGHFIIAEPEGLTSLAQTAQTWARVASPTTSVYVTVEPPRVILFFHGRSPDPTSHFRKDGLFLARDFLHWDEGRHNSGKDS